MNKKTWKLFIVMLFCQLAIMASQAQDLLTIRGQVLDGNGTALPGVSVKIKDKPIGAITDVNGNYTLRIPTNGNHILEFSYIGFETFQLQTSTEQTVYNVRMISSASDLNEVVVVGYGTQKKVNLTGSVSTINNEELAKRPVMRASAALQGLAPGVTVTQGSGQPGSDGGTIRIRGTGTLGNSNALVLIDGVQGSIDAIHPNDIESVTVLKDASASAIYGSRAANGVILVTTKLAGSEELRLSYETYVGKQVFTELPEFVDGYTYMSKINEAYANVGKTPLYSEDYLSKYQQFKLTDPDHYPDTDWQKELYKGSGLTQNHYVSVSGGKKVNILSSFGYQDQQGQIPGFSAQRYSLRLNAKMHIKENLQATVYLMGRHMPTSYPTAQNNIKSAVNRTPPIYPARLSDGRWGVGSNGNNIVAQAAEGGLDRTYNSQLRSTFQLNYQPIKDLDIEGSFTPDYTGADRKAFNKSILTYDPTVETPLYTVPALSTLTRSDSKTWQNTGRLVARYSTSISKHDLAFLAGYEQIAYKTESMSAYRIGFPFPEYQELDAGSADAWTNGGTSAEWGLQSYFGRFNYTYDNKYLFEANLRFDGSSRFPDGKKFGTFPSFSAGWRLSEEQFLKDVSWLSELKLRGSWGMLGNQEIGNYPFSSVITLGRSYVLNGIGIDGAGQKEMVNENISWEETTTTDIGIDASFLQNKLSLTADYFNRRTTGILLRLPVAAIIGLTEPYQNAGVVNNKGWELALNYKNKAGNFNYQVGFNISDVKNEIEDLKGAGPIIDGFTINQEGYPISTLFGYRSLGLFQNAEQVGAAPKHIGVYGPGDVMYDDIDGNGSIGAEDRVPLGDQFPRYTFGMNLAAQIKGFDISLFIQGVGKRDVLFNGDAIWALYNNGKMQIWQLDSWTPSNTGAAYPRLIAETSHNNFQNTSYWVYSGAYARLKNIQIGYTLPEKLTSRLPFSRLRVYATGDNIFSLDHMPKGWDPEKPSGDATVYPVNSTYLFGLNLSF